MTCEMCGKTTHSGDGLDRLARDCGGDCWECLLYEESAPGVAEFALEHVERALRAEALVRAKDEAIGELMEIVEAQYCHYCGEWGA